MACYYPSTAWRSQKVNPSGKRGVTFNMNEGFLDMPLQLPCGKCFGCRADRSLVWSLRMYHEASLSPRNSFLTLTYADAPPALVKDDLVKFIKRLRHSFDFRYFACGEYGDRTRRPHYHAVFFGEDFRDDSFSVSSSLYSHPRVLDSWGHGHVAIADFSMAAACYVAGYVHKKVGDTDTFTLMSRKPPIGSDWLKKYRPEVLANGSVVVEGREYPVPACYLDWEADFLLPVKDARRALVTPRDLNQLRAAEKQRKAEIKLRSKSL